MTYSGDTAVITVTPQKGGSYYGSADARITDVSEKLREVWRDNVPNALEFESKKMARDGTEALHITVTSPNETRQLRKSGIDVTPITRGRFIVTPVGVGRVTDGDNETWFIVFESPALQSARAEVGLPPKDLHATLGFAVKDIFTTPKTSETIVNLED